METNIYIQLLNEGTIVYRPVPCFEIGDNVYKVGGHKIYDPEDETWEFLPGSVVLVEEQTREGRNVLVAIKEVERK